MALANKQYDKKNDKMEEQLLSVKHTMNYNFILALETA